MAEISKNTKIVGVGEVVYDILPDDRKLGGAPIDFLRYAVKNGGDSYIISAIGADDLGREVVSELNKLEITPVLEITPYPTGRVLIFNNPIGGQTSHVLENASWDYIPFSEASEQCIKTADVVYFSSLALRKAYTRATIADLLDAVDEKTIKFFDINLQANYYNADVISEFLYKTDILRVNANELKVLRNLLHIRGTNDDVCEKIKRDYNLKYLIFYDNLKEVRILGDNEVSETKNLRINQMYAEQAGVAFSYTFITEIINGIPQKDAHDEANKKAIEFCKTLRK